MYEMSLEGAMLESFIVELANMIGGNTCINVDLEWLKLELTPPTVLVGQTKLSGFKHALIVLMELESVGMLNLVLILEDNN